MGTSRLPRAWAGIRTTTKNCCNKFVSTGVCSGSHITSRHHRWPRTGTANFAFGLTDLAQGWQQPGHNPAAVESLSPLACHYADGAVSCLAGGRRALDKKFLETAGRYSWLSDRTCFERRSLAQLWRLPGQSTSGRSLSASGGETRSVTWSHFSRCDFASALWWPDPPVLFQHQRPVAPHGQKRSNCRLSRCHTVIFRDFASPSKEGPRIRRTRHRKHRPC